MTYCDKENITQVFMNVQ